MRRGEGRSGACWLLASLLVSLEVAAATAGLPSAPHHTRAELASAQLSSYQSHGTFSYVASSSSRRALHQAASANNRDLPRVVIGRVKTTVSNTYSWSIQRQSSASGVAVTADGYNRKQLGYTLTFTRTLTKTEYRLEGIATIAGQGTGSATLLSLQIIAGGREVQPVCQGMPASRYELLPGALIECAFVVTWSADPGTDIVSGYVQTSFGRAPATGAPVPYSFSNCGGSGDGSGSSGTAAPCSVVETGACVSVTDGAYIVNKYKDKLGQQLAGTVTRSRLFETGTIQDSTLGPPRIEPPTPAATVTVARVPDDPPVWSPKMPDKSWWSNSASGHHHHHHHRLLLSRQASDVSKWPRTPAQLSSRHSSISRTTSSDNDNNDANNNARSSSRDGSSRDGSSSSRRLFALTQSKKDELTAVFDANFNWPYPTITGDRPPVGLNGRPERASSRQICGTRSFAFGMVWGPLLPAACGTFEVQNFAGAVPTDNSGPPVTSNTYTYLQVVCPAAGATAVQEKASKAELRQAAASNKAAPPKEKGN